MPIDDDAVQHDPGVANPSTRRGSVVAYPAYPWTRSVHGYLRHLEQRGFDGAQRVVGSGFDGEGNELLSWMPGVLHPRAVWPSPHESLRDLGELLRRLHDTSRSYVAPEDASWMPSSLRAAGDGAIVSHRNVAPWHVVFDEGRVAGLIGWEYAGPTDPLDEVAVTAWYCVQMVDADVAGPIGLPGAEVRAEWFRSFLDGYDLAREHRGGLVERMLRFAITDNGEYARARGFTPESTDGHWTLVWQSRAALWTLEHCELLTRVALR